MSATPDFGFGKFVPGFDFLQNLAKGTSQAMPQMPSLSNWIAPTINVEELDKRISELKAVQFWLDQNAKALAATIQALEVQKMTLATLQGMKVNMEEVAESLKARTADAMTGMQKMSQAATEAAANAGKAAANTGKAAARPGGNGGDAGAASGPAVDPLQWWGALTQQFQQIAVQALEGVAQNGAMAAARASGEAAPASAPAKQAAKAANAAPAKTPAKAAARKAPARKAAARKPDAER